MGKEIVYCGGCGKSLYHEEFEKGKAHVVDNQPFCIACRPLSSPPSAPQTPSPHHFSSTKIQALKSSTTRRARADSSARGSRTPLIVGGALIGLAALIVIAVVISGSGGRTDGPVPPPPPGPSADGAAAAMRDLESFAASSTDPDAVLRRCDEARAAVRGSPLEPKFRILEQRAKDQLLARERDRKVGVALDSVRQIRSVDPRFERSPEIDALLKSALDAGGPRRAEVEKLKEEYDRDRAAFLAKPPPPPPPPPVPAVDASFGPFELGAKGEIQQWLALGPFPNRNHLEGMYDHDLLHTQEAHRPAAGLAVRTRQGAELRWTPALSTDGKLLFTGLEFFGMASKPKDPAIAFAACWVDAENDTEIKFRVRGEAGWLMYLDYKKLANRQKGFGFADPEEVLRTKLSRGRHQLLFKVATPGGGGFGLAVRVTTLAGERAGGVRIWTSSEDRARLLFAENFNGGPGGFTGGDWVDGGADGTKVLSVSNKGAAVERPFDVPVTPTLRLRCRVKMPPNVDEFALTLFGKNTRKNYWYKVRDFKTGEWSAIDIRLADLREGVKMAGPGVEGELPNNFRFILPDAPDDARMLVDDVEILDIP